MIEGTQTDIDNVLSTPLCKDLDYIRTAPNFLHILKIVDLESTVKKIFEHSYLFRHTLYRPLHSYYDTI